MAKGVEPNVGSWSLGKMASNTPKPTFDEKLLSYVQALAEIQSRNRSAPSTDPNYLAQLEQARSNISQLLNVLHNGSRHEDNLHHQLEDFQTMWQSQISTSVDDDDDEEDIYENTGPGSVLAARAADIAAARSVVESVEGKTIRMDDQ